MAGGYQKPSKPASVSGPGKLSRRTDGGPAQKLRDIPDAKYGENADFRGLQQSAPLAQQPSPQGQSAPSATQAPEAHGVIPLNTPSARPNEPVTTGAAVGPGSGPSALGLPPPAPSGGGSLIDVLSQLQPFDVTGAVADLMAQAMHRSA
jgi:hypothetical protein